MAELPPDFTFFRDGRPLSAWLLDLVADDRPTRHEAGEALGGMWMGLPRYSTKWSDVELPKGRAIAEQGERFKEAVKAAVDAPGFQRTFFVQRLCWLRLALHEDWLEKVNQKASNRPNHGRAPGATDREDPLVRRRDRTCSGRSKVLQALLCLARA